MFWNGKFVFLFILFYTFNLDFCKIINGIDCDNNSSRQSYDSTCNVVDSHYNACISEKILNESVQESEIDIAKNINDNVEDNNDIDNNADRCSFIPPYQSGGEVLPMISQQTEYSQDLPINLLPSSLTFSFSESQTSKVKYS